jgi:photosystem II stability/assembly factor-like uncharacterized protein
MLIGQFTIAQWQRTGPYGGNITAIGAADSVLLAGTGNEAYFSDDNGMNWTLNILYGFNSFLHYNSKILAGNDSGIFLSEDQAATWERLNSTIIKSSCLCQNGVSLFAGTRDAGVFESTDEGTTWTAVNNGLTELNINCLFAFNGVLFAGTNEGGLFSTIDNGANWTLLNNGIPTNSIITDLTVFDSVLYAGVYGTGVYKSTNVGNQWTFSSGLNTFITALEISGNIIYAGTSNGVYKSTNGQNWSTVNSGLINKDVNDLLTKGSDLFAATKDGIYLLPVGTTTWYPVFNGIYNNSMIRSITDAGNSLFACNSNGIFLTSDNGSSWSYKNNGIVNPIVNCLASNWSEVYAGVSNQVYKTTNGGINWSQLSTSSSWLVTSIELFGNTVFAGTTNCIKRSDNNGLSWIDITNGIADSNVVAIAVNDPYVFVGTDDNGIFYSNNGGTSWLAAGPGLSDFILSLAVNNTDLYAGTFSGIFKSSDNGLTWTHVFYSINQMKNTILTLDEIENCVFAGSASGIIYTKNNGVDWNEINDGLTNLKIHAVGTDQTYLYAGTENGIWKRPLADFNIVANPYVKSNSDFTIFPNPATTTIFFNNPDPVEVEILNLQGQSVTTSSIPPYGSIDVSALKSGVYLAKIRTDDRLITKRIIKQ